MTYYLRRIVKDNWEKPSSEDDLPGEAITVDWNSKGNEWSVFKCSSFCKKDKETNSIVLRMVGDNTKATSNGIDLLYLEESFLNDVGLQIVADDETRINTLHCNLRDVNYPLLKKMVTHTYNEIKKGCILTYTPIEIRELFLDADDAYKESYTKVYKKDTLSRILKAFFIDKSLKEIFNI